MSNPPDKINVNIVFSREEKETFEKYYTKSLFKIFIKRCVERANMSKDFFDDVFFGTQDFRR